MAYTVNPGTIGTTSIEDFIAYCKSYVDPDDDESMLKASDHLAALANDRTLLIRSVNSELQRLLQSEDREWGISSQSIIIYSDPLFKVRANIWKPPVEREGKTDHDDRIYSYQYAHNHDFHLLTVGYLGRGYSTEFYECDLRKVVGYIGEKVDLRFLERTSLPRGRVLLMRAGQDVHTQLPPDEYSVSLNLIISQSSRQSFEQFSFDIPTSTITGVISTPCNREITALSFVAAIGSRDHLSLTLDIARSHAYWRVRLAAYECCIGLVKEQSASFWEMAALDRSERIREIAAAQLR